MKKIEFHQVRRGIFLSVLAQVISLAVSFLLNLIVPKFIDEYQYSYWQTYMLYIAYVGILHFGLLDGIVLRYSQYDYEELDQPRLRSQFQFLLTITTVASVLGILAASCFFENVSRIIVVLVSVSVITKNIFTYTSYSFQITNRIRQYAFLVIGQRSFYGIGIVLLLVLGVEHFYWFCIFDLCSDLFGVLLGSVYNKGLYFGKTVSLRETFAETAINIRSGIILLVANWSSVFLIGSAKMIVQWRWDELVFGKVAFAFSASNLFLSFVTAISVVLFPTLKRLEQDRLPTVYKSIRDLISPVLFWVMLFYFPGCLILEAWLPKYSESLIYLGILLPIIVYTSKVSLLTNNYLKAYRKEQSMLIVNLISIVLSVGVSLICAVVAENLKALLIGVVAVVMVRSIFSELVVMREIGIRFVADFLIEAVMTVCFVVCAMLPTMWLGCAIYGGILLVYSLRYKNNLKSMFERIRKKILKG